MSDVTSKLPRRRLRRTFYVVLLAALIGLTVSFWSWVDAQARAVVVISSVLDAPVLTPAVRATSGEPRLSDTRVAGYPSLVAKPAGEGPWPAIFVVNGTVPEGRELPAVRNLAEGFARAGYLAVVPDLPGLTEDRITPRTVNAATEAARKISTRPDAENGEVAMVGVSTGATLALLAAEDPRLDGKVSLVAGVAPFSNIRDRPQRRHDRPLPPARRKTRPLRGDPLPLLRRRPLAGRRPATRRGQANTIGRDLKRRPRKPGPAAKSSLPPDGRPGTESKERRPAARQPRPGALRRSLRGPPRRSYATTSKNSRRSPEKRRSASPSSSPRAPTTRISRPRSHTHSNV